MALTKVSYSMIQGAPFNVLDFGAVGDGSTNDSAAVQAAIDAVADIGFGTIVFPSGKSFYLDTQINVCDNLVVMGYGAKIIAGTGWSNIDAPLFKNFTATKTSISPGAITATENVAFYGLEFDGGDTGGASGVADASMHGMFICMGNRTDINSGVNGFTVQDCYMHDMNGAAVLTYGGQNINISNNKFVNFYVNVSLSIGAGLMLTDVNGFVVDANTFDHTSANWSWHGMTILDFNSNSTNGTVSNNVIRNMNQGDGISCEGNSGNNLENVTFVGNAIADCVGDGIGVDGCIQVIVDANTIKNVGGIGIVIGQTERMIISNNSLQTIGSTAIYGSGDKSTITGNSITETTYKNATYQGDGIFLAPTSLSSSNSIQIVGNYLKDIDGGGIVVASQSSIVGNFVFNAGRSASATRRSAITVESDSVVTSNILQSINNTTYGILCIGNVCTISNNQFLGTWATGKVYVGYRGAVSTGIVMNQNRIEADGVTGNITIWSTTTPATGYWIVGDIVYNTAPSSGGYIGWTVTTTPSTWKTFGLIS